jgi:hypothetical protein
MDEKRGAGGTGSGKHGGSGKQGYSVGARPARRPPASAPGPVAAPRRRRLVPILIAAAVLVIAAAAAAYAVASRGPKSYKSALKSGGCTDRTFGADAGGVHLTANEKPPKYDSDPPTHGKHNPVWAIWGIYDAEVPQDQLIHNLEHAGLVIQYGPKVPAATVDRIRNDVLANREFTILAPYSHLGDRIAFEQWSHLVECKRYEPTIFKTLHAKVNTPVGSVESEVPKIWAQERRQPGF